MTRKITYELSEYEIIQILAKYFEIKPENVNLTAETFIMGYEIQAPIKAEIRIKECD